MKRDLARSREGREEANCKSTTGLRSRRICSQRRAAGRPGRARAGAGGWRLRCYEISKTCNALSRSKPLFSGDFGPSYDLSQQIDADLLAVVRIRKHEQEITFIHMLVLSSRFWPFESQFSQTTDQLLSGNWSQSRQLLQSPGKEFLWSGR